MMRVIPAWAGNTVSPDPLAKRSAGHPRVGGEHNGQRVGLTVVGGSSPRGRGTLVGMRPQ